MCDGTLVIADICHIKGERQGSARHDVDQTISERDDFDKLILLCPTHHRMVDADESTYSAEYLTDMKLKHQSGIVEFQVSDELITAAELKEFNFIGSNNYNSVDFSTNLTTIQSSALEARKIEACDRVWKIAVELKKSFGGLTLVHQVLLPSEIDEIFRNQGDKLSRYDIIKYRDFRGIKLNFAKLNTDDIENERPHISNNTFSLMFKLRALYGRLGFLCEKSFEQGKFIDWRKDSVVRQIFCSVFPEEFFERVAAHELQGWDIMINSIEEKILKSLQKLQ